MNVTTVWNAYMIQNEYWMVSSFTSTCTYLLKFLNSGNHLSFQCDVSNSASVTNLVDKIKEKYSAAPQIAVNAAGIIRNKRMMKLTEEDFEEVIDVNLKVCS